MASKGTRGRGRPKGSKNKTTLAVKEALAAAFTEIGGVKALTAWGRNKKNRTEFYKLWAKLLPQEMKHTGHDGGPLKVQVYIPTNGRDTIPTAPAKPGPGTG